MANIHSYTWKLYCDDESTYKTVYNTSQKHMPSCPTDSNHVINVEKSSYTYNAEVFEEVYRQHHKKGFYRSRGYEMTCPANTITQLDISYPYKIFFLHTIAFTEDENKGDVLHALVGPDMLVGIVTSICSISDSVIPVNSTCIDATEIGVNMKFAGDTTEYEVTDYDLKNSTISISPNLAVALTPGAFVTRSVKLADHIYLPSKNKFSLGDKNLVPQFLPPNTVIRVCYDNKSGTEKKFRFFVEFF